MEPAQGPLGFALGQVWQEGWAGEGGASSLGVPWGVAPWHLSRLGDGAGGMQVEALGGGTHPLHLRDPRPAGRSCRSGRPRRTWPMWGQRLPLTLSVLVLTECGDPAWDKWLR